jgi:hypothetical protein
LHVLERVLRGRCQPALTALRDACVQYCEKQGVLKSMIKKHKKRARRSGVESPLHAPVVAALTAAAGIELGLQK